MRHDLHHLKRISESQQQRKLRWLVGAYLESNNPELFLSVAEQALSLPNEQLGKLLWTAEQYRFRTKRLKNRTINGARNSFNGVDDNEAEEALKTIRNNPKQ